MIFPCFRDNDKEENESRVMKIAVLVEELDVSNLLSS